MHTPDGSGKQEVSTHLFFVGCQGSRTTEGTSAQVEVVQLLLLILPQSRGLMRLNCQCYFDAEFGFE